LCQKANRSARIHIFTNDLDAQASEHEIATGKVVESIGATPEMLN
jgi:hypothetical protein